MTIINYHDTIKSHTLSNFISNFQNTIKRLLTPKTVSLLTSSILNTIAFYSYMSEAFPIFLFPTRFLCC